MSIIVESSRSFKNIVSPFRSKIKIASAFAMKSFDLGLDSGIAFFEGGPSFFTKWESEVEKNRYNV